jgi:hypothetical protein
MLNAGDPEACGNRGSGDSPVPPNNGIELTNRISKLRSFINPPLRRIITPKVVEDQVKSPH